MGMDSGTHLKASTGEAEAGRPLGVGGQPDPHSTFQARQGCTLRLCLKNRTTATKTSNKKDPPSPF